MFFSNLILIFFPINHYPLIIPLSQVEVGCCPTSKWPGAAHHMDHSPTELYSMAALCCMQECLSHSVSPTFPPRCMHVHPTFGSPAAPRYTDSARSPGCIMPATKMEAESRSWGREREPRDPAAAARAVLEVVASWEPGGCKINSSWMHAAHRAAN